MQRELEWYRKMKKRVPPELTTMRNKDGKTPRDMFYANHRKLSNEVKDTAKAVANSGMVVAALVVTVAFAAALTTPGDKNNAWFAVFIMANTIAFFTSALSIVAFLSIFTSSRFEESDFIFSLYPNLIIGKKLLYISVVTMIIAFAAASFLIFGHIYKWVAYVVTSFGLLTIIFVLELQLSLFSRYIKPCLWYIIVGTIQLAHRISNFLPHLPVSGSESSD
ncbi:ankyrin repeat-containing protein ITN1-like [Lotus japonicus]|uniref:ankyrin repeat-containing protein ITN1-like n=1 Tax=Lotus japonicus TaxID=34305 RepID=UPI002588E627|nr:ankyrin repeat-containing protein ITN1-like [Lotus japonicus]